MSQHHPKAVMGPFFTDSFSLLHQDQHNRFILGKHRKQTRPTTRLNQTPASKSSNLSLCFPPYHAPHYFYFALFVLSPRLKVGRAAEELSEGGRLERSLWRFEDGLISLSSVSQFVISPHSTATARDQASFRLHQKVAPGSSDWHLTSAKRSPHSSWTRLSLPAVLPGSHQMATLSHRICKPAQDYDSCLWLQQAECAHMKGRLKPLVYPSLQDYSRSVTDLHMWHE